MRFEWDPQKAEANKKKHKVAFDEARSVFYGSLSETVPDPDHSLSEMRFITVGPSEKGRLLFVSHMDRGNTIRIISARCATPKERRDYENNSQD